MISSALTFLSVKCHFRILHYVFFFMLTRSLSCYCISDAFVIFGLIVKVKGSENGKIQAQAAVLTWPKKNHI